MHPVKKWPRLMLTLPYFLRIAITALCSLAALITYIVTFPTVHNGNILPVAVCMAAWMLKKRGLLIFFCTGALALIIYHIIRLGGLLWPYSFAFSFIIGLLILLLEGLFIIALRDLLESADKARNIAQEAEKRIEAAYEQQYQLNQIKDQFLLNMNHELRTPLTELHAYLELLYDRHEQLNSSVRTRYIEHAFQASKEIQQLTYNVMDAMQIDEQGKMLIAEEFTLVNQVDDIIKHLNTDKQQSYIIQTAIPAHLTVFANAQAVRQILHNLLSNIFKYVPPQTKIIIAAEQTTAQEAGREYVCISVQDEGPGIPPGEIPLLFKHFVRLKRDISGPLRGTGLGLYICRKLVETMGGSIWVESDGILGHGSRFCFILPTAKPKSQPLNISIEENRINKQR